MTLPPQTVEALVTPRLDKLLTLDETAELLRKTPDALRWMVNQGTAPRSAKIGRRRLFRLTDVEAYIAAAFEEAE